MLSQSRYCVLLLFNLALATGLMAQYHPGADLPGTNAIHADSSAIKGWAVGYSIKRGYMQINDRTPGTASAGSDSSCTGKADNIAVSLGDSGCAVVSFAEPVRNISGPDFAVFENSFDGQFLELAFVEVSTDSIRWVRFPAASQTQNLIQTGTFGITDPTGINNLAGKYKVLYGTPFDLNELADSSGIDLNNINYIRIIDVIGSITDPFATVDALNKRINDPWPTPFPQSGFDLDAVAVLRSVTSQIQDQSENTAVIYPNPAYDHLTVRFAHPGKRLISVFDQTGRSMIRHLEDGILCRIDISGLKRGIYFLKVTGGGSFSTHKFIKS